MKMACELGSQVTRHCLCHFLFSTPQQNVLAFRPSLVIETLLQLSTREVAEHAFKFVRFVRHDYVGWYEMFEMFETFKALYGYGAFEVYALSTKETPLRLSSEESFCCRARKSAELGHPADSREP